MSRSKLFARAGLFANKAGDYIRNHFQSEPFLLHLRTVNVIDFERKKHRDNKYISETN